MENIVSVLNHLKVFLCHSSNDKLQVRDLYKRLVSDGYDAWLDEEKIKPGQKWNLVINDAVRTSDIVIVCLSRGSISKTGYVQKEIRIALDAADEHPDNAIFLIPARLEECDVPPRLRIWQWVDLFEPRGYSKLLAALQEQERFLELSTSHYNEVQVESIPYSWQSFQSFRYLAGLDPIGVRKNEMQSSQIRSLNAKSEFVETLLFGDGIVLSENQILDSRCAIESLGELIRSAKKARVKVPIRVASRIPNLSFFALASQRIGYIDQSQIFQRFVISANPALDLDVERRKLWSGYLSQGIPGLFGILQYSSSSEAEFINNWFTVLDYLDDNHDLVIGAKNIPEHFSRQITRILGLTVSDLKDMSAQTRDAVIPDIVHPQWLSSDEAESAAKIISGLQSIVAEIGGIPKGRSPLYAELATLVKTNSSLADGIREVVDTIYSYTEALSVGADSLSNVIRGDMRNILVRAGHNLAQWACQTEENIEGNYSYESPWAWVVTNQLTWSDNLQPDQIKDVIEGVPWQAILEATKEPGWKMSLANYRTALEILQSINRNAVSLGSMGKEWRQKHIDARKSLNDTWTNHIEISARLISNQYWKLTAEGIRYHHLEDGDRPLPIFQNYRTMGTLADYSTETLSFRNKVNQKTEFEQNIFGMITELAKKAPH